MSLSKNCLEWITTQHDRAIALVEHWSSINSGTDHPEGIRRVAQAILPELSIFGSQPQLVQIPAAQQVNSRGLIVHRELGPVLRLRVRPAASRRVLLAIHLDTVYGKDSEFQTVRLDAEKMYGPGAADAKGGIAVMILALQALEQFVEQSGQHQLGWEVILNSDEEIGSPGSTSLFREVAERNHLGLLFEPALPDGNLAGNRKGSANFSIVCRGKSAHAGRHFDEGINAIAAAAEMAGQFHALNGTWPGTTLNVARIDGGGPMNMVPDVAVVRVNVRYDHTRREGDVAAELSRIIETTDRKYGTRSERHGTFTTPPKQIGGTMEVLFEQVLACGRNLGLTLNPRETGGVCDGNRLAGWGLPNIDTLGVRGGAIHSPEEFLILESLTERAQLTASLLIGWCSGDLPWPGRSD